jgi:hypothetical protein
MERKVDSHIKNLRRSVPRRNSIWHRLPSG